MANTAATFNINQNAADYTVGDNLGTYSGVNLWLSDDSADQLTPEEINDVVPGGTFTKQVDEDGNPIILGYKSNPWSNSGRVLDIVNPFGTVAMASDILRALRQTNGIALNYSPFDADALIPPHFELGDAVVINNDHHGIYGFNTKASRLPKSNINAPADEEIDHEYPFRSDVKSRQLTRKFDSIQSQFIVQAGKISAKVSRVGENESHTFGWSLTENGFYINNGEVRADGTDLFSFDSSGLHIKGDIEADTGHIGGSGGFTIQSGKLYSGKSSYSSSANGVYIGTDGISLGSGFKVSSGGSLTATSGTFGSLSVSNGNTKGSYYGNLSNCGGSVSGGCSISGTGYSMGGIANSIGSLENRVSAIYADYINTNNLSSKIASLGGVTITNLTVTNGVALGGRQAQWTYNSDIGHYILIS
ncbi:MAG: hypothetical protein IIW75_08650 [Bacteroidaceae bacterium]|nr:hypothetical protein [Bacteroidaceae bacterium]